MKTYTKNLSAFVLCVLLSPIISAQSGGTYEITQSVIAGGGGESIGGPYGLTGTIG